jgi:DNA-binding CsgD family transcriptional regulator
MGGLDEQRNRALQFSSLAEPSMVLDFLEAGYRDAGATHFLATGLPLPGRPITSLLLRARWNEWQDSRPATLAGLDAGDPLFHMVLGLQRPASGTANELLGAAAGISPLVEAAGLSPDAKYMVVPIKVLQPYQAVVIAAGEALEDCDSLIGMLEYFSLAAFRRMIVLQAIDLSRPGGLSLRERHVVELSACGKTAQEIAAILNISQRTVHAHLQNASAKLKACNKTQTVVEALRHGQIKI